MLWIQKDILYTRCLLHFTIISCTKILFQICFQELSICIFLTYVQSLTFLWNQSFKTIILKFFNNKQNDVNLILKGLGRQILYSFYINLGVLHQLLV